MGKKPKKKPAKQQLVAANRKPAKRSDKLHRALKESQPFQQTGRDTEAAAWTRYRRRPTVELRNRLAHAYLYLAYSYCRTQFPTLTDQQRQDVRPFIENRLISCIPRYIPVPGIPFARYLRSQVRGAVLDGLKSMRFASRTDVAAHARYLDAKDRLQDQLGREPSEAEVIEASAGDTSLLVTLPAQVPIATTECDERTQDDEVLGIVLRARPEHVSADEFFRWLTEGMPAEPLAILWLVHCAGRSVKEVAEFLRMSRDAVYNAIKAAKSYILTHRSYRDAVEFVHGS